MTIYNDIANKERGDRLSRSSARIPYLQVLELQRTERGE
eukprot:CAMPEP_0206139824 /NCGR_PEP_ID=MMETSP1473-20131121/7455_1 /ASSEMBLY_ACC=CAM_ASM_001109 /TAXON_ID=1461547 /ORGANISM="Stichococcus sp, Strain RCC1054" /LENGTH=38 /DNA_ID= /DNA_START= /DNA_END= /DNA_ORIENTATION=